MDVHATVYTANQRIFKKVESHAAAVALYFMYYKFGHVRQTLRLGSRLLWKLGSRIMWTVKEIVGLLDQ